MAVASTVEEVLRNNFFLFLSIDNPLLKTFLRGHTLFWLLQTAALLPSSAHRFEEYENI